MKQIIVAGDVVIDHHLYEGERLTPASTRRRGVREVKQAGGASTIVQILAPLIKGIQEEQKSAREKPETGNVPVAPEELWDVHLGISEPDKNGAACGHHSFAIWTPHRKQNPEPGKKEPGPAEDIWRARLLMGYGHDESQPAASKPEEHIAQCPNHAPKVRKRPLDGDILVLDDAGFVFRSRDLKECWLLPKADEGVPSWIVHKMASPVASGDLWNSLVQEHASRLIVVVSAQDLRRECAWISQGISWEATVEGTLRALDENPKLRQMLQCEHLIVTFSSDAALWIHGGGGENSRRTFVFDPERAENEWAGQFPGEAFGYLSCMVAAVVRGLVHHEERKVQASSPLPDLYEAISAGLSSMRSLRESGHGRVIDEEPSGLPHKRLAGALRSPRHFFARAPVPAWLRISGQRAGRWSIIEASQTVSGQAGSPLHALARRVVLHGPIALAALPHARFGKLVAVDRQEIESLRTIRNLMLAHQADPKTCKPLSVGVFGPPGAGKSFGVQEISNRIFGEKAWLEFNLSQFRDPSDLFGAFHQIRDLVLSGITPVAFWDEFDSRGFMWLQYLLAPMQDGKFQELQLSHSIGKCVFIMAGGTSFTYQEFGTIHPARTEGPEAEEKRRKEENRLKELKVPDFRSRLDAYYNVTGPNQRVKRSGSPEELDPDDIAWPVRRALLITSTLPPPFGTSLHMDPGVLRALLESPGYPYGTRSMNKLLAFLKSAPDGHVMRSLLPPEMLLAMHTEKPKEKEPSFQELVHQEKEEALEIYEPNLETLACSIHDNWRQLSRQRGYPMTPEFDRAFGELDPHQQEDNREAARRIPKVLALIGLRLVGESTANAYPAQEVRKVDDFMEQHLELLAEAEHNGWMEARFSAGWKLGKPKNVKKLIHPALVPYQELGHADREKDRDSVRQYRRMAESARYRIAFAT